MSDLVPGTVDYKMGSIKIVHIDGFISEKTLYDGHRWIPVCRKANCSKENFRDHVVCEEHYKEQVSVNIEGEKITRGSRKYKWTNYKWIEICTMPFCEKEATKGLCLKHSRKKQPMYSTQQNISSMYNIAKQELMILRQKKIRS
jgi:hypothetical protein